MAIELYDHQVEAIKNMKNGCILVGGMGSGKSLTALAYYYTRVCEGKLRIHGSDSEYGRMKRPRDLVIITTAQKRDNHEWDHDLCYINLARGENPLYGVKVYIDSWNNIAKYRKIHGAMFIFDEQHTKGGRKWAKAFLDITRKNQWILLSATPGDKWIDYVPVFIANGFFRSKTEFEIKHCIFAPYKKYKQITGYLDEGKLWKYKKAITVEMPYIKPTVPHRIVFTCEYDKLLYKTVWRDRWDPYENCPIRETGKLLYLLRRVVNSDKSRIETVKEIVSEHPRVVIFYNHTYELEMLRCLFEQLNIPYGEWNGQVHSSIPDTESWAYLVNYSAGSEGWNCTSTNTLIFYSQNYSYSTMEQAKGRIDRMNTPYIDLYYYHLRSSAPIDLAIARSLKNKKDFNEKKFVTD